MSTAPNPVPAFLHLHRPTRVRLLLPDRRDPRSVRSSRHTLLVPVRRPGCGHRVLAGHLPGLAFRSQPLHLDGFLVWTFGPPVVARPGHLSREAGQGYVFAAE